MKLVTVMLPEAYLEGLDELVRAGVYPSRSAAIRAAVRSLLKLELWQQNKRRELGCIAFKDKKYKYVPLWALLPALKSRDAAKGYLTN